MYTPPKAPPDLMSSLALVLDMAKAHIKSLELQYGECLKRGNCLFISSI